MKAANIFQALRHALSADRSQDTRRVASGPTALSRDMLGFVAGGKGDRPAPTSGPSLPKHTW